MSPASIATGVLFVGCMLAFRRGIVGELRARAKPRRVAEPQGDAAKAFKPPAATAGLL